VKLFIVEDRISSILAFLSAASLKKWPFYNFSLGEGAVSSDDNLRRFLREVCEERPDIVILDAALTDREAKLLDELTADGDEVSDSDLSGLKYCQALSQERVGIPIVLLTKYTHGQVARAAMWVGADHVLGVALILDIDLKLLEQPSVVDEVSIL